jgi:hypothetical protein
VLSASQRRRQVRATVPSRDPFVEEDLAMSDPSPAPGDAEAQPNSEPDVADADEFAKMRAVMRASEKHREGGIDPELEVTDPEPGPDT